MDRRTMTWMFGATLGTVAFLLAWLASQRGTPGSMLPHGYCFTWNPTLLWTHVISDSLIGLAYVSIPVTLIHLVRKRTDLPFNWIVVLFAIFIISCGATHVIEVWTVWNPDYWLSGAVKVVTASASVLTAGALVMLVPRILAIPTVAQLTAAKTALEAEIESRKRAEAALMEERDVLESRVLYRTQALAQATAAARAAHADAEEANTLKDRFLAKVSHELRTPLQSTLSWAQVLKLSSKDPTSAGQAADRIIHNVRTQARLIDDLLDISRILSGKLGLRLESVDATAVIVKAVEVVRSGAAARGITVELAGEGGVTPMHSDPVRLEQVVWNLVNNAVQASADGGRVEVRHTSRADLLEIEVQDGGHGIAAEEIANIFEPFRQGAKARSSHRGLGLGLAITRSIVELFGGRISVHSAGLGQGATFNVQLPMAHGAQGQTAADLGGPSVELSAADRQRLAHLRVLYVEDEADIAESGRRLLVSLGAQVQVCPGFEPARQAVEAGGFDVLLSDLNLGDGHTAIELIRVLRAQPGGAQTPAIVVSAYGGQDHRQASIDAGFVAHLVKPAAAADVARALLDALARRGG